MDERLAALLMLRKKTQDGAIIDNDAPPVNLTTPEEYEQMPPELQELVKQRALMKNQGYRGANYWNAGEGYNDSKLAERMSNDVERQDFRNWEEKFSKGVDVTDYIKNSKDVPLEGNGEQEPYYQGKLMPYVEPERFNKLLNLLKSSK